MMSIILPYSIILMSRWQRSLDNIRCSENFRLRSFVAAHTYRIILLYDNNPMSTVSGSIKFRLMAILAFWLNHHGVLQRRRSGSPQALLIRAHCSRTTQRFTSTFVEICFSCNIHNYILAPELIKSTP